MSLFQKEYLECPCCHKDIPFIMHNCINVGINPEYKEKILDYTLFQYRCPRCKYTDSVCYPTLYYDPPNGIMIQVTWKKEDSGRPVKKGVPPSKRVPGLKYYRRREVFDYEELIEKIRIFDAGLNDFAIALLKTVRKMHNLDIQLFFYEKTNKKLLFEQHLNNEILPEFFILEESIYETALQYANELQDHQKFYEFLRVDESYFHQDIIESLWQEAQGLQEQNPPLARTTFGIFVLGGVVLLLSWIIINAFKDDTWTTAEIILLVIIIIVDIPLTINLIRSIHSRIKRQKLINSVNELQIKYKNEQTETASGCLFFVGWMGAISAAIIFFLGFALDNFEPMFMGLVGFIVSICILIFVNKSHPASKDQNYE